MLRCGGVGFAKLHSCQATSLHTSEGVVGSVLVRLECVNAQ